MTSGPSTDAGDLVPVDRVGSGTVLFICATKKPAPGSNQRSAVRGLLSQAASQLRTIYPDVAMLDLRDFEIPHFDGRTVDAIDSRDLSLVRDAVARAGALVLAAPVYWSGVSGVFKNLIDVLCGPAYDLPRPTRSVFTGKPVGLIVVCACPEDAEVGARHSKEIMLSTGARVVDEPIVVANPRALAQLPEACAALIAVAGHLAQLAYMHPSTRVVDGT